MEAVDVIRVATKIRSIAQDPQHRPYIIRRGILPSIVTFAQNESVEVRTIAADILRTLGSHPDNKKPMSQEPQLISSVCAILKSTNIPNLSEKEATLRSYATEVLVSLSDHLSEEQLTGEGVSLKEILVKTLRAKEQQLEKSHKKHNLVLEVEELRNGETIRAQLQKIIIQIKGNISYTISVAEKRVALYTRAPTESVIQLLGEKGFTCRVKSDAICETEYRKTVQNSFSEEDKENKQPVTSKVKYLAPEVNKHAIDQSYKTSLMDYDDSSSYEAKLAQRQKKVEKKKKEEPVAEQSSSVSRFFGKITSVFW